MLVVVVVVIAGVCPDIVDESSDMDMPPGTNPADAGAAVGDSQKGEPWDSVGDGVLDS